MTVVHARRVTARRASLQDVNAIVRLLTSDHRLTAEQAAFISEFQPQLRLTLAHFGLEAGDVLVAESDAGTLLATAVWMPPGVVFGADEQKALLGLHGLEPPTTTRSRELQPLTAGEEHVRLAAVGVAPGAHHTTLETLMNPVLRWADAVRLPIYATTLACLQAELLSPFGFAPSQTGSTATESWLRRAPADRAGSRPGTEAEAGAAGSPMCGPRPPRPALGGG
ncbi:hypothetical protein [Streptomyces sp. NPDC055749]